MNMIEPITISVSIILTRRVKLNVYAYSALDWFATINTDLSRAEKLWLICGVMGDVIPCERDRDIHPSQKFDASIHSEKNDIPHNSFILQT
jgi:hypothetical protein